MTHRVCHPNAIANRKIKLHGKCHAKNRTESTFETLIVDHRRGFAAYAAPRMRPVVGNVRCCQTASVPAPITGTSRTVSQLLRINRQERVKSFHPGQLHQVKDGRQSRWLRRQPTSAMLFHALLLTASCWDLAQTAATNFYGRYLTDCGEKVRGDLLRQAPSQTWNWRST